MLHSSDSSDRIVVDYPKFSEQTGIVVREVTNGRVFLSETLSDSYGPKTPFCLCGRGSKKNLSTAVKFNGVNYIINFGTPSEEDLRRMIR